MALSNRWRPRHVDRSISALAVSQHNRAAVEPRDRPAIELPQQIGDIRRHDIDERRRRVERLAFGEGAAFIDTACSASVTLRAARSASVRA